MSEMMRAVAMHEHGGADVLKLEQWPVPEIGDGEVLIAAHACGINPIDFKMRDGARRPIDPSLFPVVLGWDISGVVAETNSPDFSIGDEVFGLVRFPEYVGGYADFVAAPASDLAPKPKSIDHVHAAAVPLAALTTWQTLFDDAMLEAGQRILIHAAAGGVGHFAVQFAKWKGAHVIGTASARNREFVLGLGADEVVDYTSVDFAEAVHDVDVVLHSIGPEFRDQSYRTLKKGGILAAILMPVPTPEEAAPYGARNSLTLVHTDGEQMNQIGRLIEDGAVEPHVDATFPLDRAADAHRHVETGHTRGKVVITIKD